LAVARSNLVERVARPTKPHRAYRKAADEPLLVLIRRLVDERPTYGYRRITRLVNRQQKAEGKPAINAKRVLRIMQVNKLYQPELDLTVCAWFERSGFVSEVIRLRSFSPSSSAWHRGRSASGFCRSTSVPDAAAPHYIL